MNEESPVVAVLDAHPNGAPALDSDSPIPEAAQSPPQAVVAAKQANEPPRRRPAWVLSTAIAVVGVAVSGALAGLLVPTISQRDSARTQLAATRVSLGRQLQASQANIVALRRSGAYGDMVIRDSGRVMIDYETIAGCKAFSDCRTAAQQMLDDLQAFQGDRAAASPPAALENGDGMLRDSLSAAISGQQELITAIDNDDSAKGDDAGKQVNAAMLSLGKAETTLAAGLH